MSKRPETGPMQFGDDWPGVFIRGDNALGWAIELETLVDHAERNGWPLVFSSLRPLLAALASCDSRREPAVQHADLLCCPLDVQLRGCNMVALTCHCGEPCAYESGLCARCGAPR